MPLGSQHSTGGQLKWGDPELWVSAMEDCSSKPTWEHPQACWSEGEPWEISLKVMRFGAMKSQRVKLRWFARRQTHMFFLPLPEGQLCRRQGRTRKVGWRTPFSPHCSTTCHKHGYETQPSLQGGHWKEMRWRMERHKQERGSKALRAWFTLWHARKGTELHHSRLGWVLHSQRPNSSLWIRSCWLHTPPPHAAPYCKPLKTVPSGTIPCSRGGHTAELQDSQETLLWAGCIPSSSWYAGGSAAPASSPMPVGPTPTLPVCSHGIFQGSRNATPGSLYMCVSTHFHSYLQAELYWLMNTEGS